MNINQHWKEIFRVGAIATILSEVILFLGIALYFVYPFAPGSKSTEAIFMLLQKDVFGGLISLDFHLVLGNLLGLFLFIALYAALKPVNESYALIALVLGILADILIIPARPIYEMFTLSGLYAGATSEAARSQYLAAGEALVATFNGTAWFTNTLLGGISLLISSWLMLRGKVFSKATAWVGIVTNGAVCLFFIPGIGKVFLLLSLLGYMVWYVQLARRFFQLAKEG
jgi:hypothetical protein